ncbi:amino acid adenylation domain-containing protein [Streptomyces sp. B21-079]|uniref:amino acid adenylation domain-containing protein n=1 Tax=Streptomyces sp. B21-079 TaxID=3039409 RepID=UPI002FF271A0
MSATGPARQAVSQARLDAMSPAKRALLAKRLAGRGARTADSVVPVPRDGQLAVSAAQRRLWYMDQLSPGSAVFNLSVALRLTGPLKTEVLQTAVRQVFARHESLRTVFPAPGGSPVQRILPEIKAGLTPVVLMDDADAGAGLVAALEAEAARPFSLEHGPLARVRLFQCDPAEHVLLLVIHHSVCDGWSMSIVIDELMKLYAAGVRGGEAELEPLRVQYADYTAWEAEPKREDELAPQLDYWRRTLRGAPATVDLPIDRPRAAVQSFRGALHRFTLPSGTWSAVQDVARAEQATPFMVLLAAFAALLSRGSTQGEVTVATPVANRPLDEIQNVVGFFANSIALRLDTSGDPAFRELVGRVRDVTQEGLARSGVPFDRVVEAVDPARSLAHAPMAQVSFALLDDQAMDDTVGELRVTTVDHHTGTAKYDLTLELWPDGAGELHGTLEYATDLFDPRTVTELVRRFGTLLGHLAHEPGTTVGHAPLLSDEEARRIEEALRTADEPMPFDGRCVHEEFERQVRRTPDLPALVDGERTLTFGELDERADRFARLLRGAGAGSGARVALCLERGVDLVAGVLGTLKAGAVCVPVDPAHPVGVIARLLDDADVTVLLTSARHAGALPAGRPRVLVEEDPDGPAPAGGSARPLPESASCVLYDPGVTSRPEGLVVTHRSLAHHCAAGGAPAGFVLAVADVLGTLLSGRTAHFTAEAPAAGGTDGAPGPGTRFHVLDGALRPAAPGTVGELWLGGAGVALGYWHRPDLTAQRFLPDPFSEAPGARLHRTGDLVRVGPDGAVEYVGRVDDRVRVAGQLTEPAQARAVLERLPEVREAVVVPRTDLPGGTALVAYVAVPDTAAHDAGDGTAATTADALRAALAREIPARTVPEHLVVLDALPRTSDGEIDWPAFPHPTVAGGAVPDGAADVPRTPLERTVAEVWGQVLGLPEVGRDAGFLALGGHSLLATQAVARLRDALGLDIPLRVFLRASSLADLAARIEGLGGEPRRRRVVPTPRTTPAPLSYAQGRLYFLSRLAEDSSFYNVPIALRLDGALDRAALRQAFAALWARHDGLRTYFPSLDGEPMQAILPARHVPFDEVNLEGEAQQRALVDELVDVESRTPFDLSEGPLLRGRLLCLAPDAHVLVMTLHHAVSDGWSVAIVLDELVALYRAFREGEPSPLKPVPLTYVDYTRWQRSWLKGAELDSQLTYWKRTLADVPMLELPTDRPRPAAQSFRGARHEMRWGPELSRSVTELARREGVTPFMVLLAGFDVLMAHSSGQRDITVGTPVAGRTMTELEPLVGFFANTLALRVDLSGDPTFAELLERVRERAHGAYAHQDVPFEMVVDAVAPQRSLSHSPLFQVRFALQNQNDVLPDPGDGLTLTELEGEQHTARFDLVVDLWETERGLEGQAEYSTDLFDADTVARMMDRFETLLERLVADPRQRVLGDLDLLTEEERRRIDALSRGPELPADADARTFVARFVEQAALRPDAPAVTCGDTTLTYGELRRRSGALARVLAAAGVGPGATAAVYLDRGVEFLVAALAVMEAGGAYVPLDPAYPAQRRAAIVADARPALTVTSRALAGSAGEAPGGLLVLEDVEAEMPVLTDPAPLVDLSPDLPAYVVYTSGTKGLPKGVVLSHRGLAGYVQALPEAVGLPAEPVYLHTASFGFSSSVRQFAVPLAHGGHVVVADRDVIASPETLLAYAAGHGVQVLDLVPSYLRVVQPALAQHGGWRPELVLTASEPLLYDLPEALRAAPGGTPRLVNMYGQTETTGIVAAAPVADEREGRGAVVPLGRPIGGARVHVLDGRLRPVPVGHEGEIVVGGTGLALGYLGDPALTAERFVPDPYGAEGSRLYRTGDRGRLLPDGKVEFLGRIGDQVKIRGHRVELAEVASVLSACDGVAECAVLCVADGPDERRLVGHVALSSGSGATAESLRAALREKLPDYMIPTLVLLDALPRLPNGKVDRGALATTTAPPVTARATAPSSRAEETLAGIWRDVLRLSVVGPDDDFFALGGDSLHVIRVVDRARKAGIAVTPAQFIAHPTIAGLAKVAGGGRRERAEETLAGIWRDVLRLSVVGPDDDFFALGGDSLHVIRVVDRARKAGIAVTPAQFIAHPTIAGLAQVAGAPAASAGQGADTGPVPLVPSHLAFLERDFPDKETYTHPFIFEAVAPLDPKLVERAVGCVLEHHESLRICFPKDQGTYRVQVQERFERTPFTSVDLSALDPAAQKVAFQRLDAALHRKLDFANGPLLHVALVKFGPDRPDTLIVVVHHQLMDNSSWDVLMEDIQAAYTALAAGNQPQLEPPTSSFAAWARNLDRLARSPELDADAAYWTALAKRPVPHWPLDHEGGEDCMSTEESVVIGLDVEETAALRLAMRRAYGLSVNEALLAATLRGFTEWSGQSSVIVDMVARGRELGGDELDLSRAIGRFSMTSPRLLEVPEEGGARALLDSVAAQLEAVPRKGLGFGLLRYIGARPGAAEALAPLGKPHILLNNWGDFDNVVEESPVLGPPIEDAWPMPKLQRMHRLMIDCRVYSGALRVGFRFSRNLNERASIERLAGLVEATLRTLVRPEGR